MTRTLKRADVEQTEARPRRQRQSEPRTDDSSLTPRSLLFVYSAHLQPEAAGGGGDRQGTVTQSFGRLKGFHLFRLQDKQLRWKHVDFCVNSLQS